MSSEHIAETGNAGAEQQMEIIQSFVRDLRNCSSIDAQLKIDAFIMNQPTLKSELLRAIRDMRRPSVSIPSVEQHSDPNEDATVDHTTPSKASRGLHIRCPHCSNFVEVVTDTPYEEISCGSCGSMFSLVSRDDSTRMATPLKSIDRFDLVARLGIGGFGTVWKAHDRDLDRTVALKLPRRGQLSETEIDQFFREARAAAQLRHSNIVSVHEVGRDGDSLFIVSDFIRGVTLTDWLTAHRPSSREVAELCIPIADALHHAHKQGVVHRDLKPSNILLDERGSPHITDFGLAKREVGEVTMTVEGQVLGTPGYMSPEQASGQAHWTDRRSDIYSLGVILFELLTGELPFRGNIQMQIHQRLTTDPPDPQTLNRHIPKDLSTICLKCMEREPGRRYPTATAVIDELQRFLRGEPILARPLSPLGRVIRLAKRKPMASICVGLVLFLAIAGPLAAAYIARQRAQLELRLADRDHLIEVSAQTARKAGIAMQELQRKLDAWEGRISPTELWPPLRDNSPRKLIVKSFFDDANQRLRSQLDSGRLDPLQVARGYLALSMLADTAGDVATARQDYKAAAASLEALSKSNGSNEPLQRALACCYTRLSSTEEKHDPDAATKSLDRARSIYQQLAESNVSNTKARVDRLESEVRSAAMKGADRSIEGIQRIDKLNDELVTMWPADPDRAYELACYLTHTEPLLSHSLAPTKRAGSNKLTPAK